MPAFLENFLLHPDIQRFIVSSSGKDTTALALMKNPFPDADWKEILNQIAARSKAAAKLPTWYKTPGIIWPSKISVEQTSSEITAGYKSNLVSGNSLIDLTGGFGVDDFYFARRMQSVTHCEISADLSAIARHNFERLEANNIECLAGNGIEILQTTESKFDWIYIDPSRRHDAKGKVFMLGDCLPDVPGHLDLLFTFTDNIMIKVSPLLDITAGLSELKNVKAIHVVAVKNEVKELLWVLEKDYLGTIAVNTVDISAAGARSFSFAYGCQPNAFYAMPSGYLYEPNAAIMKSGGFDAVTARYNIAKLHRHSHLYTSENVVDDFPGRTFKIEAVLPYTKPEMKKLAAKANITVRNFPENVESLRKKWKIADGGDQYYFFTTNMTNEKIILICAKI